MSRLLLDAVTTLHTQRSMFGDNYDVLWALGMSWKLYAAAAVAAPLNAEQSTVVISCSFHFSCRRWHLFAVSDLTRPQECLRKSCRFFFSHSFVLRCLCDFYLLITSQINTKTRKQNESRRAIVDSTLSYQRIIVSYGSIAVANVQTSLRS